MKNLVQQAQSSENENESLESSISRRKFLTAAAAALLMISPLMQNLVLAQSNMPGLDAAGKINLKGKVMLLPFDYRNVKLGSSRWQQQYQSARDFYLSVSDDDILCGFRRTAGLDAPGAPLGGWAARDSYVIFGQWLQAMAKTSRANDDADLRNKAVKLVDEWAKTLPANGDLNLHHYPWEKLLGGLSDMKQYAGYDKADSLMERITDWAIDNLDRTRTPAANKPWDLHSGVPLEWYTLSENLYRAYLVTGDKKYKDFGDVWRYDSFWNKFADTSDPKDAHGVHAYSHCNSFSGAAMAYLIEGDEKLLRCMTNFYDFLQDSQTYATGGYGPAERYLINDGALGESLESRLDSFEAPCCSWAAFKLAKYLTMFTGHSRYGDWMERLLYNAIGAALPIVENGKHFYYANYHLGSGQKVYSRSNYTCCSGTYFHNIAEYQNLIYFNDVDNNALCVNLYLPSQVTWTPADDSARPVKITQQTDYPEGETINFKLDMTAPFVFSLKFRVPAWSKNVSFKINGSAANATVKPGNWATIKRQWRSGDQIQMTIPLTFRRSPIDKWHPNRIAIVRGPVVYAQQIVHKNLVSIPSDDDALNKWMVPTDNPVVFQYVGQEQSSQRDDFMPFYMFGEMNRYRMYFDSSMRNILW
jgi:DUF1680 family protein